MTTRSARRLAPLVAALLFLSIIAPAAARVDGVTVKGTVFYSTTPIVGMLVELRADSGSGPLIATTTSSPGGEYAFTGVPAGTHGLIPRGASAGYIDGPVFTLVVAGANVVKYLYLEKPITLLEPAQDSLVTTPSPRFCWAGLPEAAGYALQVNRTSDWAVAEYNYDITDTCYTTTAVLEAGVHYTWMVEAADSAGHRVGRTAHWFHFTVGATGVTVSGTVYYATTPLAGVVVELRRDGFSGPLLGTSTSDAAGNYEFTAVPPGTFYLIPLRPSGEYVGGVSDMVVVADSDVVFDIYLAKVITLLEPAQGSVVTTPVGVRFCWSGLPEAATYRLLIHRWSDLVLVGLSPGITDTCTTTTAGLAPGIEFGWVVQAVDGDGHRVGLPAEWFRFTWEPLPYWTYIPLALRRVSP
jgi:hypothetical protein